MRWLNRNRQDKSRRNLDVRFYHEHDALIAEAVKAAKEAQDALVRQQNILIQLRTQLEGRQLHERQTLAARHLKERQALEIKQEVQEVHELESRQLQERRDLEAKQEVGGTNILEGDTSGE